VLIRIVFTFNYYMQEHVSKRTFALYLNVIKKEKVILLNSEKVRE